MAVFFYDRDDINTDLLFPGKYTYSCSKGPEIREHLFEDLDPEFAGKVKPGDVVMAGRNFGCGSSREQPALGLKYVGVAAVVAKSFSRIFYRSAINQGLLLVECPAAVDSWMPGADVRVDAAKGLVTVAGKDFSFPALPAEMLEILRAGGLLEHIAAGLAGRKGSN
jgi:3-isopropylmalate/(R)-2-methylmalate dehydratase small subunit